MKRLDDDKRDVLLSIALLPFVLAALMKLVMPAAVMLVQSLH